MTGVWRGIFAGALVALTPAVTTATEPEMKASRDGDRVTVTLHIGDLRVTETLSRGALELRLVTRDDNLRFAGDLEGRVLIERGEKRSVFAIKGATIADQAAFNEVIAQSQALAAFDALLESAWAETPVATLFRSTRAVIRVLEGGAEAMTAMTAPRPLATPAIRLIGQRLSPSQCYDTYTRDVIHFTYELQQCLSSVGSQWWNPLATWFCGYEYNLKSSLAAIWLLDCYGVWA